MSKYRFSMNRDSGCVRRHRNPDTHRRWDVTNLPKGRIQDPRPVNDFIRAHKAELATGLFDISFARVVRGWDPGDLMSTGDPVLVESNLLEDPFEYPETPDWVWDELYALTNGIEWYEEYAA